MDGLQGSADDSFTIFGLLEGLFVNPIGIDEMWSSKEETYGGFGLMNGGAYATKLFESPVKARSVCGHINGKKNEYWAGQRGNVVTVYPTDGHMLTQTDLEVIAGYHVRKKSEKIDYSGFTLLEKESGAMKCFDTSSQAHHARNHISGQGAYRAFQRGNIVTVCSADGKGMTSEDLEVIAGYNTRKKSEKIDYRGFTLVDEGHHATKLFRTARQAYVVANGINTQGAYSAVREGNRVMVCSKERELTSEDLDVIAGYNKHNSRKRDASEQGVYTDHVKRSRNEGCARVTL